VRGGRPPQTSQQLPLNYIRSMSAWDQTVVIGQKVRPGGGSSAPRGPTALERAKQVGAVNQFDRKSTCSF